MVDFRHPRERRGFLVPVIVAGLVVALVALGWVSYATLQDLARARDDLNAANVSLVTTRASLTSETSAHADASNQVTDLTGQVTQLKSTLSNQANCTTQLLNEVSELNRISDLQRQNYNRFAEKSKWAGANVARNTALNNALNDYFKAYKAAFGKQYASANSWIATGNKQVSVANAKLSVMQGEVTAGNAATKTIGDALTALISSVAATQATCSAAG